MLPKNFFNLLLLSALPLTAHAAESYTIDPPHTFAHFSISHLGFSTMQGRFDNSSGKVTLDRVAKTGSLDIAIEAASISTGFAKRDTHLKGPDFFNSAEYPRITYQSNSIKFKGDIPVSAEGKLTLLGVTKPVTLSIDSFKCGVNPMSQLPQCGAAASTQIKRSDFGMKFALPNVGDEVKLVFEVEAYKD